MCHRASPTAAWVDFGCPPLVTRTGPQVGEGEGEGAPLPRFRASPWRQGVVLLSEPRPLEAGALVGVRLALDVRRGGVLTARLA